MDFDWIFGEVARECGIPYSEIVKQTPRQTFGHFWRRREKQELPEGLQDTIGEGGGGDYESFVNQAPKNVKPRPGDRTWHPWAPLHKYECWAYIEGEEDLDDKLVVPREIAKERHYTQMFEFCRFGMLRNVIGEDGKEFKVDKHDMEGLRDICDYSWAKSEEKFQKWCEENPEKVEAHRRQHEARKKREGVTHAVSHNGSKSA